MNTDNSDSSRHASAWLTVVCVVLIVVMAIVATIGR